MQQTWYVYLLQTENDKIYTGISPDVNARFDKHALGKGALFTKLNKPLKVLAFKAFSSKREAAMVEIQIKKIPKASKLTIASLWNAEKNPEIVRIN